MTDILQTIFLIQIDVPFSVFWPLYVSLNLDGLWFTEHIGLSLHVLVEYNVKPSETI